MREKWVSHEKALEELGRIGLSKGSWPQMLLTKKGILESDLDLIKQSTRAWGMENFQAFVGWLDPITAYVQVTKPHERQVPLPELNATPRVFILRNFFAPLSEAINKIARRGYQLRLGSGGDLKGRERNCCIQVYKKNPNNERGKLVFSFHFDLVLGKNNAPTVLLGNMQGGKYNNLVKEFEAALKKPLLSHLVDSFCEAFPRAYAINPKLHSYMDTNELATAHSMKKSGQLSEKELGLFQKHFVNGSVRDPATEKNLQTIREKVNSEITRIKTQTPGMHYSAYRKAAKQSGFTITDSMKKRRTYLRLK
ncbi:MAG: hypothetical protein V1494_07210 [Candidatus Diapherotrites archaeon]